MVNASADRCLSLCVASARSNITTCAYECHRHAALGLRALDGIHGKPLQALGMCHWRAIRTRVVLFGELPIV